MQILDSNIVEDVSMLKEVRVFLEQLEAPFGFLIKEARDIANRLPDEQSAEPEKPDHKYFKQEKAMEARFDGLAALVAQKAGLDHNNIPWAMATLCVLGVYLILTIFAMFYRADFLSLTICTMGIYIIDNPQNCDRGTFRMLVVAIVVSWVYDILFLWLRSASHENKLSGGTEGTVIYFSFTCAWISFFWRILVALVFWKDSLDFNNIV